MKKVWNSPSEKEGGWTNEGKGWLQHGRGGHTWACVCMCAHACALWTGPLASRLVERKMLCPPISALVGAGPPKDTWNPSKPEGEGRQWSAHLYRTLHVPHPQEAHRAKRLKPPDGLWRQGSMRPELRTDWLPTLGSSPACTVYILVAVGKSPNL